MNDDGKSSVQKSNVIWYLIVCFALHHFSSFFWKLCGQINARQTNYICELSACMPFCRKTHTHFCSVEKFLDSRTQIGSCSSSLYLWPLAFTLCIELQPNCWIDLYIFICTTCSHISHSIWRNINNTKAWAKAKCSNLTEIFALLLWILVLHTRSLLLCLFCFSFSFSIPHNLPILYRMSHAFQMQNYQLLQYTSRLHSFFLFETMKLVKCCLVRLQFFSYIFPNVKV